MYTPPDQGGRRIVVTGANSGTGKEAMKRLAAAGAEVVMAVRAVSKGEAAKEEILLEVPGAKLEVRRLDLADLSSVREFAEEILLDNRPLHTLVNNAGVMTPPKRETTKDGFELQLGSNFLGPFLLTNLLIPKLRESENPRVVTMSSIATRSASMNYDDLDSEKSYHPMTVYGQSKLADHLMSLHLGELSDRNGWGILSVAAHPGVTRTNLQTSGPNLGTDRTSTPLYVRLLPLMDVRQGAESLLKAASEPDAEQGDYYGPRFVVFGKARKVAVPGAVRRSDAAKLWEVASGLVGIKEMVDLRQ